MPIIKIILAILISAGVYLWMRGSRKRRQDQERGWRVAHKGRDELEYEELIGTAWVGITIGGEMLMGTPRHVIYFPNEITWAEYPEWARSRRSEIIARIKLACPPPEYDHNGG